MRARFDHGCAWILVAWSVGLAVWLLVGQVRVTQEDGFYYFKIAQYVARGAGTTFDGLHPTNGYHPLWLLGLVPVFWLTSSPVAALWLGTLLQAVVLGLGAACLYHAARLTLSGFAASLAAFLWIALVHRVSLGGMEFSLYALCFLATTSLYLRRFANPTPPSIRVFWGLGLLLSLAFLSRLDAILLTGILVASQAWREWRAGLTLRGLGRLVALGTPALLAVLLYAEVNRRMFGHSWPVSGALKREWSAYLLAHDPLFRSHGWLAAKVHNALWPLAHLNGLYPLYVALGTFGVGALWAVAGLGPWSAPWPVSVRRAFEQWQPFVLYSLLSFVAYAWLYHGSLSMPTWYYVAQPWLVVICAATLADRAITAWRSVPKPTWWASWDRRATMLGLIVLWCSVPVHTALSVERWRDREQRRVLPRPLYDAADWVRSNLPADAVIGSWNAGTIGYLSGRRVVNLDGVVNSWEYALTERHDLCRYWRSTGITHLVDAFEGGQALSVLPTYAAYARCANRLERLWSDNRYSTSWSMEAHRLRLAGP